MTPSNGFFFIANAIGKLACQTVMKIEQAMSLEN
jgi:hypothetical protein